jgi:hypothetical protein
MLRNGFPGSLLGRILLPSHRAAAIELSGRNIVAPVQAVREPIGLRGKRGGAAVMKKMIVMIVLIFSHPAMAAGSSVPYGMGGNFSRFDPVVAQYNQSGELFRIQGHCQSACTLFLSIRNICIERSAALLFHAGNQRPREMTNSSTTHMLGAYNAALREYVTANHYMETREFHAISGRDMIAKFGYRECPK